MYLGDDLFRLSLNGAVATITLPAEARQQLHWHCTRCQGACEHVGAAFSLILELAVEKVALGLAAPPPERVPIESLSEEELVAQAVAERDERSRKERMTLAATIRSRLDDCLERGDDDRVKLTVTLADSAAVERLANSFARLLATAQVSGGCSPS